MRNIRNRKTNRHFFSKVKTEYDIIRRRMYVVKKQGLPSNRLFNSLNQAVSESIIASREDTYKYLIYKVNQYKMMDHHPPKTVVYRGRKYSDKHWRAVGYHKFLSSLGK